VSLGGRALAVARSLFGGAPASVAPANDQSAVRATQRIIAAQAGRALAGGRLTVGKGQDRAFAGTWTIVPPPTSESDWRAFNLDSKTLDRMHPARLMELLADLSPDVSRALWDWLRLTNPGYEVTAVRPGTDTPDTRAQAAVDAFLGRLTDLHGTLDVVIGRLFTAAWLRGALLAELVLDERGREPVDLATPDPAVVRFKDLPDPVRGRVWQLGQYQRGQWVALDRPTIRYVPIDPFPDSPYGRAIATPGLFTSLFLLGLLHDLRRVVAQQGYPRIDLEIDVKAMLEAMPDLANDPEEFKAWVDATTKEIQSIYAALEPDDAYVHASVVRVNRPVGTVDSDSLGAVGDLIKALERMAVRALKTNALLMGLSEGLSEASANRLWELGAASIKAIQHYAESVLGELFGLALEAQGIQATVVWRFAELRASEAFRDETTLRIKIDNWRQMYQMGVVSQDELAAALVGHPPDQEGPRAAVEGSPNPLEGEGAGDPEPGENRLIDIPTVRTPTLNGSGVHGT